MSEGAVNTLGPKGLKFFEDRGLDPEIASVKLGIHTGKRKGERQVVPAADGNIIVFPVLDRNGVRLYDKYRGLPKSFWREDGTEGIAPVFYGAEVLADPALYRENDPQPLVIVEGYEDRIAAIMAGRPLTVSVPDGAPTPGKDRGDAKKDIDPEEEARGKFSFLWTHHQDLKRIRRFIIAVDNDINGKFLAEEIVRRLGPAKCSFVEYPEGCKDLGDVIEKHGLEGVTRVLHNAKPYPVRGLFKLSDYPDKPPIRLFASGWPEFDAHFQIFPGAFVNITGIPSHGKSTFLGNWLVNLSERYGWRHALISPEMPLVPMLRDKLRRQYLRAALYENGQAKHSPALIKRADDFIEAHFCFIEPDANYEEDDELSVSWLLEKAEDALVRYGINTLSVDPWNELEHAIDRGETETRYIGRNLRAINRWGKRHSVANFVLAHPTKEVGKEGKARRPTPYDIDGGAHWYNKPDANIVVHRPDEARHESELRIAKVRHDETGKKGTVTLAFDVPSQRYSTPDLSEVFPV